MCLWCTAQDDRVSTATRREDQRLGRPLERALDAEQDVLQDGEEGMPSPTVPHDYSLTRTLSTAKLLLHHHVERSFAPSHLAGSHTTLGTSHCTQLMTHITRHIWIHAHYLPQVDPLLRSVLVRSIHGLFMAAIYHNYFYLSRSWSGRVRRG